MPDLYPFVLKKVTVQQPNGMGFAERKAFPQGGKVASGVSRKPDDG
jgi:hypothetical protein